MIIKLDDHCLSPNGLTVHDPFQTPAYFVSVRTYILLYIYNMNVVGHF